MNAQECIYKLCEYLLGSDFYIVDPVGVDRGNEIIVDTILNKYSKDYRKERKLSLDICKTVESLTPEIKHLIYVPDPENPESPTTPITILGRISLLRGLLLEEASTGDILVAKNDLPLQNLNISGSPKEELYRTFVSMNSTIADKDLVDIYHVGTNKIYRYKFYLGCAGEFLGSFGRISDTEVRKYVARFRTIKDRNKFSVVLGTMTDKEANKLSQTIAEKYKSSCELISVNIEESDNEQK